MKRLLWMLAAAGSLAAQTLSYVASVKPNYAVDARGLSEYSPGGRFTATAISAASLIRTAYRIQGDQLVGAPGWFSTKRYDISAKADENPAPTQQALLRALLKDSFKLIVHEETREMPVFALVLARNDRSLGPKLVKSDSDCVACGARSNSGSFSGKAVQISQLAASLAFFAGRFVIDKTGLAGGYDMELTWTPDDSDGPSLFTALQEQLGLKLVAERGSVNALVVDRASEPVPE